MYKCTKHSRRHRVFQSNLSVNPDRHMQHWPDGRFVCVFCAVLFFSVPRYLMITLTKLFFFFSFSLPTFNSSAHFLKHYRASDSWNKNSKYCFKLKRPPQILIITLVLILFSVFFKVAFIYFCAYCIVGTKQLDNSNSIKCEVFLNERNKKSYLLAFQVPFLLNYIFLYSTSSMFK